MDFEEYSYRLLSLHEFCGQAPKKIQQKRFQVLNNKMQMISVKKTQLAELNDKRFYFYNGIVSLPFGHYLLEDSGKLKEKFKSSIITEISKQKYDFLRVEVVAVRKCERLRSIFNQPPLYCLLDSVNLVKGQTCKSSREQILNATWK